MAQEIDRLEVKVQTSVNDLGATIESMCSQLDSLKGSLAPVSNATTRFNRAISGLSKVDKSEGFASLTRNATMLSTAMNELSGANFDATNLVAFKEQIRSINRSTQNNDGSALALLTTRLQKFAESMQNLGEYGTQTQTITELAKAVSRFGYETTEKAIANLPILAERINGLIDTLSKAPSVSDKTIKLVQAVSDLANASGKVSNSTKTVDTNLKKVNATSLITKLRFSSLATVMGTLYANFFMLKRAISAVWKASENAMNYVETFNYFSVALGKIASENAERFERFGYNDAESYADSFSARLRELTEKMSGYKIGEDGALNVTENIGLGLNPTQIMQFQARISAISNSVGMLGETSVDTSKSLSMLAYDLSSLTNTDVETVMNNITAGITGSARAMYKYGIDITNASLSQIALANGIEKSVSEMSQSEKMQLRVLAILKQSKVAWGDQANTLNSAANQFRVLKQQIQNIGTTIGALLLPVVTRTLPYINALVISLNKVLSDIGFSVYGDTWWDSLLDSISSYNAGDGFDDLEDDVEGAEKSLKSLKHQLQGFDELNVLSSDTDKDSILGSLGALDLSDQIKKATEEYEKIWNEAYTNADSTVGRLASMFEKKLAPVKKLFEDIFSGNWFEAGQDVSEITTSIFDTLSNAIADVDFKEIGTAIMTFLNGIDYLGIIRSVGNFFETLFDSAVDLWKGMFDANPIVVGIATALGIASLTPLSSKIVDILTKACPSNLSIGKTILIAGITFKVGFDVGKEIGKALFPEDAELYENFTIFGKNGLLGEGGLIDTMFQQAIDGELPQSLASFPEDLFEKCKKTWGIEDGGIAEKLLRVAFYGVQGLDSNFSFTNILEGWELFSEVDSWEDLVSEDAMIFKLRDFKDYFDNLETDTKWKFTLSVIAPPLAVIERIVSNAKKSLTDKWDNFKLEFDTVVKNVSTNVESAKAKLSEAWGTFKLKFTTYVSKPSASVSEAKDLLRTAWNNFALTFGIKTPTEKTIKTSLANFKATISDIWNNFKVALNLSLDTQAMKNAWNSLATKINNTFKITFDEKTQLGKMLSTALGNGVAAMKLPTFARGGYTPAGGGSLFWAGEGGRPELMGTINGRNAVASNREITGIVQAVNQQEETERRLLETLINVLMSKEFGISESQLFNSVQRSANDYYRANGKLAFNYR